MKRVIITISREFGCGGREIARKLASELGVKFYDKDLVDMAAQKAGVHIDVFKNTDEVVVKRSSGKLFREFGYGSSTAFYSEQAIEAQAQVIRDIANKQESCIMFGRCSDYILREHPNVINFFLYAPLAYRVRHIAKAYELDDRESAKLIKRVDKQRHNYYKYVTGQNRGDRNGKDLLIDVEAFGVDGTVEMMKDAVEYLYHD